MKIAIDTRCLGNNNTIGYGFYLSEILSRITIEHTSDEFLFIFDKPYNTTSPFGNNVQFLVVGPTITNPLLLKLWYDVKLPALLKKNRVDVFVAGPGVCSLNTRVAQCLVIDDLSYLHFTSVVKKTERFFLKRYTKKFIHKADRIVTVSAYLEKEIILNFPADKKKISVIHGAGKNFQLLKKAEKLVVREEYTDGKNFFLFAGEMDPRKNLVNLLKAFSIFKKRQKSDWKLVLAGHISPRFKDFLKNIKSYKYRDDVILLGHASEKDIEKLTGAAYAFVFPSIAEGWGVVVLNAIRCGVPVITSQNSAMSEITADAALYIDPSNYRDIAEKMMMLYKDETLHDKLIERGMQAAEEFSWDKAAMNFMLVIREIVGIKTGIYS